jgi:hypothetical protein
MAGELRRLAPNLRALRIEVQFGRESSSKRRRTIRLERKDKPPAGQSEPSETPKNTGSSAGRCPDNQPPETETNRPAPKAGPVQVSDGLDDSDAALPDHSDQFDESEPGAEEADGLAQAATRIHQREPGEEG